MAIKDSYPAIRPSLDLNFAGSGMVDPRITFTRASSATYFDDKGVMRTAPAGVPRINFDPATLECNGLLIEEQRTNLLTYSEQFDNAAWLKALTTVVPSNELAPNGVIGAKLLQETTSTGVHSIEQPAASVPINSKIAMSVFVKPSGRTKIRINSGRAANVADSGLSQFGLVGAGVVEFSSNQLASIINLGGGWYRCSVIAETNSIVVYRFITISLVNDNGTNSYAGDGASGVHIWGAQLEAGSFPTSYIKTETSQVTRAADGSSITGVDFTNLFNPNEGTVVVEADYFGPNLVDSTTTGIVTLYGGATDYFSIAARTESNSARGVILPGSSISTLSGSYQANTSKKIALAYKNNDFGLCLGGATVYTDNTNQVNTNINSLIIGAYYTTTNRRLNGHIKRIAMYNRRVANANLQALTA